MPEGMLGGKVYDTLILGGGPAGLSAAVNAKARNLDALIVDKKGLASKVRVYPEITNYLGFTRISGSDLANHYCQHFSKTGYELAKEQVLKIVPDGEMLMVSTDQRIYQSRSVILAMGVSPKSVLPGEEQYLGRGVSYCVTCDGALFRGKDIVVVGYVPEGEEEANALAGFARQVTYIAAYKNVEALDESVTLVHATPVSIEGDSKAHGVRTEDGEFKADGIFVIREALPVTTLLDDLDMEENYIKVDRHMETSIPGVYAAGDCIGPPFQIAKAVGEGQVAALNAARHAHKEKYREE